jgi:hypothetical protein
MLTVHGERKIKKLPWDLQLDITVESPTNGLAFVHLTYTYGIIW